MRHDCFFFLLFLSCRPYQLSHVVARIEEIEKKSQWIKDSGKELDLDLYGELTWLYRLLQDKNRDGQKGNIWEHLQHQQSFHFPTAHCIAMMRHPKWYISILFNNVGLNKKFLLGFNLEEEEISYPEYLPKSSTRARRWVSLCTLCSPST